MYSKKDVCWFFRYGCSNICMKIYNFGFYGLIIVYIRYYDLIIIMIFKRRVNKFKLN